MQKTNKLSPSYILHQVSEQRGFEQLLGVFCFAVLHLVMQKESIASCDTVGLGVDVGVGVGEGLRVGVGVEVGVLSLIHI